MAQEMRKERTEKTQLQYSELMGLKYDPIPEGDEQIFRFATNIPIDKVGFKEVDATQIQKVVAGLLQAYRTGGFERFIKFRYPVPPEWSEDVYALFQNELRLPKTNSLHASLEPELTRLPAKELWPAESLEGYSTIEVVRARCARQSLGTMFTNAWVGVSLANSSIKIFRSEKEIRSSFKKIQNRFGYLGSTETLPVRSFRVRSQETESTDSDTLWMGFRAPILRGNNDGPIVCCVTFYFSKTHSTWIPTRLIMVSLIKVSDIDIDF